MGKPHKWKDEIIAWANGEIIQVKTKNEDDDEWEDCDPLHPLAWLDRFEYRVKPDKEYPKSSLSDSEIFNLVDFDGDFFEKQRKLVDAAVKRHCQDQEKEGK